MEAGQFIPAVSSAPLFHIQTPSEIKVATNGTSEWHGISFEQLSG